MKKKPIKDFSLYIAKRRALLDIKIAAAINDTERMQLVAEKERMERFASAIDKKVRRNTAFGTNRIEVR